jgi:large subunit ribosomal protein L9
MFGSVTAGMIADELKHQFDIVLDKRKIHLEHPLRATGDYEIELHLHAEVKGTLKVRVESLTPVAAPTPEAVAAADAKVEKPRTEKRGHGTRAAEGEKPEKAEAAGEKKPHAAKAEKPAKAAKTPKAEKKEKAE